MEPFVYQVALGSVIFGAGLWVAWRQGDVGIGGAGLWRLTWLVGGLVAFFGLQAWLEYAPMTEAPAIPYTGDGHRPDVIGTPLDYAVMVSYFGVILVVGTWFGQNQKDTKDFFFGGQRFAWWLIAFSLVASVIGSYSFVKYSQIAYDYGLASTQTYLNDWLWLPLLLFGWLPLLYFTRLTSIPEYFHHRFGPSARHVVTALLLLYLVGYVGINLFTMGKALETLLGWDVFAAACLVAAISAVYVTFGGQTSVIMTDLFQGLMLLATGLVLLVLGAAWLGGFEELWEHLPRGHRRAFPAFAADAEYSAVGVFWQDAVANSAMFYFLNQGILMRFMAARSVDEGRKAAVATLAILMPLAAVVVASGGWVGRALVHAGVLPPDIPAKDVFFVTAEFLAMPGVFGLVLAALTAALMSTVDTLITAVAAVVVNDVIRPLRPRASEAELLRAARITSIVVALIGVALVPVFMQFKSIYAAHGAFTAAITPPLVVALLMGVFWRRATLPGALATLVGGTLAVCASVVWPDLITPFAHGVPAGEAGTGWFAGADQHKFMRALYGLVVSLVLGVGVSLLTRPRPLDEIRGYVWGTVDDAVRLYKGGAGTTTPGPWSQGRAQRAEDDARHGPGAVPGLWVGRAVAERIGAKPGDLVFVSDRRVWLGGLKACQTQLVGLLDEPEAVALAPSAWDAVGAQAGDELALQRLC